VPRMSEPLPVDALPASPILELVDRVFRMRARGEPVLGLHVGEPDFPTPPGIVAAAAEAMREGFTHYAPAAGLPELRAAIARGLAERKGLPVGPDDVVVLPAKFAIYATLLATVAPGEEVLLPDPTYLFDQPIRLAGARPVYYPLGREFGFDPAALFDAVTPRSRLAIVVSPANPTGRLLGKRDVRDLLDIAAKKELTVVSDETYESLVYEGTHVSPASVADPGTPVVTIGSFSKRFAMTGWRAGYVVAPSPIRERIVKVVEHTLTCLPPFVQRACLWALEHAGPDADRFREEFRERRNHLLARLDDLPGIECVRPDGAFYAFPRFHLPISSVEFSRRLLEEERVAVVPGVAFGARGEGHVRLSYTSPIDELETATGRLRRFLERHGADRG